MLNHGNTKLKKINHINPCDLSTLIRKFNKKQFILVMTK
jgi:hypothetical protein